MASLSTNLIVQNGSTAPAVPAFVTAMLNLMDQLIAVIAEENEVIMDRKTKEHEVILQRKQRLTVDYHASMKLLAAQPDALKALPDDVRQSLRTSANKLADVSERNGRILRSAMVATQRLLQNIISMIKLEALPAHSYKNPQTAHLQLGGYSPTCQPVVVNRTA